MKIGKKTICFFIALTGGVVLFFCVISAFINNVLMSPDYHKSLINKHGIYALISADLNGVLPSVIDNFYNTDGNTAVNKQITSDTIKSTVNSVFIEKITIPLVEGTLQYIAAEQSSLPDIDIAPITKVMEQNGMLPMQFSSKSVRKISVSALLSSLNLETTKKSISVAKTIYFYSSFIPKILIPVFIILMLLIFRLSDFQQHKLRYILLSILSMAVCCIAAVIALKLFEQKIYSMQAVIPVVFQAMPQLSRIIIPYSIDCINTSFTFLLKVGTLISFAWLAVFLFSKKYLPILPNIYNKKTDINKSIVKKASNIVLVILIFIAVINTGALFVKFRDEGLSFVLHELRGNTSIRVIPAYNSGVYSLCIKVVDKKSRPIKNVGLVVEDQTPSRVKSTNMQDTTDDTGIAKFNVDKGIYKISLDSLSFPDGYEISQPFITQVKIPGITEVTININDAHNSDDTALGIIELEILDESNVPVEGVELYISKVRPLSIAAYDSDSTNYSITNPYGIAVFHVSQGRYEIGFSDEVAQNYSKIPKPFKVNINKSGTLKYTFKLTSDVMQRTY